MTAQAANAEREGSEGTSESHGSSPSKAAEPKGSAKNFTFLTITDPKQARDKKNKKSVRSHVMFDFAARQKQSDSGVKPGRRKSAKSRQKSTSDIASSEFAYDEDSPRLGAWPLTDAVMHGLSDVRDLAQSLTLRRRSSAAGDTTGAMPNNQDISRYYRALMTLNKLGGKDAKPQEVLNQDDETFEVVWKAGFVKPYMIQGLGDEIDPFFVLPQFRNPMIYMAELKMWCTRRFGTKAMAVSWVPELAKSRFTYLASLTIGATDMDVASGLRGESALTVAVKTEVIEMVNESLADPITQYSDETLMSIDLLLCSEIVTANEWILDIHENGITRILLHKGGLDKLGLRGELAVAVTILIMNIGREKQPHQLFKDYVSLKPRAVSSKRAIPESPIYCPRGDFFTIVRSKFCTEQMYELLCDMRDLTDLFFQSFLDPDYNDKSDTVPQISCQPPPKPCDLQTAAEACLKHIETLSPLAIMSGTPMSYAAWMFEVVRVISLIYTTAIAKGIPFSKAAIIINARCEHTPIATTPGMLPSSLHSLVTALQKSNASESWGDMSGVLYWCLMVGGAATRKRGDPADWTDDDEWARRYLAATGVRLSILLCFEHAEPTTVSLRRLNKVQELLSRKRIADSPVTENVFEAINREMVEC